MWVFISCSLCVLCEDKSKDGFLINIITGAAAVSLLLLVLVILITYLATKWLTKKKMQRSSQQTVTQDSLEVQWFNCIWLLFLIPDVHLQSVFSYLRLSHCRSWSSPQASVWMPSPKALWMSRRCSIFLTVSHWKSRVSVFDDVHAPDQWFTVFRLRHTETYCANPNLFPLSSSLLLYARSLLQSLSWSTWCWT